MSLLFLLHCWLLNWMLVASYGTHNSNFYKKYISFSILLKNPEAELVPSMVCFSLLLLFPVVLFSLPYSKCRIHSQADFCHYTKIIVYFQAWYMYHHSALLIKSNEVKLIILSFNWYLCMRVHHRSASLGMEFLTVNLYKLKTNPKLGLSSLIRTNVGEKITMTSTKTQNSDHFLT